MYEQLLEELRVRMKEFDEDLQPPASTKEIEALRQRVAAQLGAELPAEYASFLQRTDGVDWNGLSLYATRTKRDPEGGFIAGFVEANLACREYEACSAFLVFGNGSGALYVFDLADQTYQVLGEISLDRQKQLASFDALITEALRDHWG